MTRRRWTVTVHTTGRPREVDVILYDNVAHLRAAAARHSNRWENPDRNDYGHTLAVVHSFRNIRVLPDGEEQEHPLAAIIRFSREHLTITVIAHEVMHAVAALYGYDLVNDGDPAEAHLHAGNEDIAELYGELFNAIWGVIEPAVLRTQHEIPSR